MPNKIKNKIVGIITARAGSKGIPNKNIVNIAGKPLLAWTIESAKKSKLINKIIVSSDSTRILEVAKKYGAETLTRPKRLSTDKAPVSLAVAHALEYLKNKEKYTPDIIVLLQPTSPLRTSVDIDKALKLLINKNAEAVISVTEGDNKYLKSFFMNKGILNGIINNLFPFKNRQELPKIYMPNGAIYIIREKEFRKNKNLFAQKTLGFEMTKEKSMDIDTREDVRIIKKYLKK